MELLLESKNRDGVNKPQNQQIWTRIAFAAALLFFGLSLGGCRMETGGLRVAPTGTSGIFSTISTVPSLTHVPLASPTSVISPTPSETYLPLPSSTLIVFPLPQSIPISTFKQPIVETMITSQTTDGGTWIIYTPPDWPKYFQQFNEYPFISSIAETPDGALWFGTHGGVAAGGVGVYRFDGKTWTHFRMENGLPFDEITSMAVSPDDAVWFGGYGVARYDGKSWTAYTTDNGLASDDVCSIAYGPDGTIWIGSSDKGLSRFDGKGWQYFLQQYSDNYIGHITVLPDSSLLFSYSNGVAELVRFDGQNWGNYQTPWTERGKYTEDIASAPNGDLWFATELLGVYRLSQNTWTHYTVKDGLPSDDIHSVAVARDGSVWVGAVNGLSRFDGKTWTTIPLQGDADNKWIGTILAATDGSVWISYYGGLARFNSPATH